MYGVFTIIHPRLGRVRLPNILVEEGEQSFLKMIARADVADVAAGGNFFIGLSGVAITPTDTLATLSGEPGVVNGYAREAVTRNSAGWPSLSQVNGLWRIATSTISFNASGGDFDANISRAFLCNVSSGSAGLLFAVSAALLTPLTITVANSPFDVVYELFAKS